MGDRAQCIAKNLQAIGLTIIFFLGQGPGEILAQVKAASPDASVPPPSMAIPLAEVATKSAEVSNALITFSGQFASSHEIERIRKSLPEISRHMDLDIIETSAILGKQPPLATLEAQQRVWQRKHLQVGAWLTLLTQRAFELRTTLDQLSQMKETWMQTRDAARGEQAPGVVLRQIEATLVSIEAAQLPLKTQEEAVLGLQAVLAEKRARCDTVLAQIVKARKSAVEGIPARESLAVWSPDLWDHARTAMPYRLRDIARGFWRGILEYAQDPSRGMPLHTALFLVLTLATCAARRKTRQWTDSGMGVSSALEVFDQPYSAALIIVLLVATAVNSPAPAHVKDVFSVLALAPMMRLVRPVIDPRLTAVVFAAVILYAVDLVRQTLGGALLVEQALLMVESLAAIAVLGWLLHAGGLRFKLGQAQDGFRSRWVSLLAKVIAFCLGSGFLAATFGFTRLARLITPTSLSSVVLALLLYAYVRVSAGVVAIALRVWPLESLQMVRIHGDSLQRWIYRLLVWTAILFWTIRSLEHIGMLDPVLSVGIAILGLKLERGSVSVSVEDILAFGATVLAAYLVSAFIRFALREEVYPRRGVARGLSYAYSRLVHYVILAIGMLVGLGVLGMELTKVSVLAGAFGVGIGFGLQNVVNNFVCGLILLFERPIHVGDTIEVGELLGEVRSIGFRASTVRVRNGADIIIPNAQFITANVTNWTFSDQLCRIDLPVGVNYGAKPQAVIELLEKAALAHSAVLKSPRPVGLFMGYGDSSINFELRAWTDYFDSWRVVRSELASAVYDAVRAAGMWFPFPQREVHLLGNSEKEKSAHPRAGDGTEPSQGDN